MERKTGGRRSENIGSMNGSAQISKAMKPAVKS